jgi:hypothetical protein
VEPDQSLDVLGGGRQEEQLLDEPQPTKAQAAKAYTTLQFREQRRATLEGKLKSSDRTRLS